MSRPINSVFSASVTPEQAAKRTADAVFSLFIKELAPFEHAKQDQFGNLTVDRWVQEGRKDTAIDLTCDHSNDVCFVSVLSHDQAHAEKVAAALQDFLMLRPSQEFTDLAVQHPGDGVALQRAAIAAGVDEQASLRDAITAALTAQEPELRAAAAKAAALVTWKSLVPQLQAAAQRESDSTIKRFLEIALKKCSQDT